MMSDILLQNKRKAICWSFLLSGKTQFNRRIIAGGLLTLLFSAALSFSNAQNTWSQKAAFGGSARWFAVGFSIQNKGYIGTGNDSNGDKNDFWEYDPLNNAWTQKANFGGTPRNTAVGFSIGSKGYIGTGSSGFNIYKDFWEYDPTTNNWVQRSDFGGTKRLEAVGFSIGDKGYIGTGWEGSTHKNDFWEYDPLTDAWTQKTNFGGTARSSAVGFSIGSKGYIGTGFDGTHKNDFWEYNPATNFWTQKAYFGGLTRRDATGFSTNGKGYIGTGDYSDSELKDFWEYNPVTNVWIQKTDFGGTARYHAIGFSIGSKGYIGTGYATNYKKDFWEYTPETPVPTCITPTILSTINITSTAATFKWLGISETLSYKVRYKTVGSSEWIVIKSIENHKTLRGLSASTEYNWQVKSFCDIKPVFSSDWSEKQFFTTDDLRLLDGTIYETMFVREDSFGEVYPNPISQSATVSFFFNEPSPVIIELMDVNGKSLRVIANKSFSEGSHEVTFYRQSLVAGIYFLQLKTNEGVLMKKLVIE